MATKSFLSPTELSEAEVKLRSPARVPDGDEKKTSDFHSFDFSNWLGEKLLARLSAHPSFDEAGPIALGSWARGELAPKADIDMIFCGNEEAVSNLVRDFAAQGLKLRYRMPEDMRDWSVGVLPFDVLALLHAKPLTEDAAEKLKSAQAKILEKGSAFKKSLTRAMTEERKTRAKRFDSISNYLEPNLKYGPGGMRDLEQALVIRALYPERFTEVGLHAFDVLRYYKAFFLLVRHRLHLGEGTGDLLIATEQKAIAEWLGFKDARDFMREIQKGVSRVSFYADWTIEQATKPRTTIQRVAGKKLEKVESLFDALTDDHSVLMQNRVRLSADHVFSKYGKSERLKVRKTIGRKLTKFIDPSGDEDRLTALFRARLIDHCVPEFRRIVGHVQHDQYHRFSVDAHILQALRELNRLRHRPKLAGKLSWVIKELTPAEWETLSFACLYHDIAKGRDGDHSVNGVSIAASDLAEFGKSDSLIEEVTWIVKEHLALSAAAFRENPRSPKTWNSLAERGVKGKRLRLLAAFTIVDIRATNPDAWTPWKETLLDELVKQLERPETGSLVSFAEQLRKQRLDAKWSEILDPFVIAAVPAKHLIEDIRAIGDVSEGEVELVPKVVQIKNGQTWIRFHTATDRAGLFLGYVGRLAANGLPIRHASIHTDPVLGVYDWFEVKTSKSAAQVKKVLSQSLVSSPSLGAASTRRFEVCFDSIELISQDENEWVISFRGRDQQGALFEAARALFELGLQIRWSKVHTWGRQIDDVFGIFPSLEEPNRITDALKKSLLLTKASLAAPSVVKLKAT